MAQRKQFGGDWFDVIVDNAFGLVFLSLPGASGCRRGLVWAQLHASYTDDNSSPCAECWGYDTVLPRPWWKWWSTDLPTVLLEATEWLERVDVSERAGATEATATIEIIKDCLKDGRVSGGVTRYQHER